MFSAHHLGLVSTNESFYNPDNFVTVMGCLEQHEFCHPAGEHVDGDPDCSGLSGSDVAYNNLDDLQLTDGQYDAGHRVANIIPPSSLQYILSSRPMGFANAASTLLGTVQTVNLPNNQWMIEIDEWLATSFAYIQGAVVQYALGQENLDAALLTLPSTPYEESMCKNQIVKSTSGYTSFSFLGVMIVLLLGSAIVVIGTFVENIAALIQTVFGGRNYHNTAWNLDNVFQTQRKAFEGFSQGTWESADGVEIPCTARNEKLKYFGFEQERNRQSFDPGEYSCIVSRHLHHILTLTTLDLKVPVSEIHSV
jgi:hypothetical protein